MPQIIPFEKLETADLIVDAVYEGGSTGQLSGEPISKLLPGCGNMGGFRMAGRGLDKNFVVLFTTGSDKNWPDTIDLNTGQFVYFGDNKTPGHELHDTKKGGNKNLRHVFDLLHSEPAQRALIPPFFIFQNYPTGNSKRSVQFKGLAVPGSPNLSATEDLVALWKTTNNQRFQNYKSVFSILNVPVLKRCWLNELSAGRRGVEQAPPEFVDWEGRGNYNLLLSEPTTVIRSVEEQRPDSKLKTDVLGAVFDHFTVNPNAFEHFAAGIFQMHEGKRVIIDEITQASVDGGRDAIGRYLLGVPDDPVYVDFALEAKCYQPGANGAKVNSVGVKEVARLISRLRHRQFGVLVTTSVIGRQAYQEVREDRHPIVFLSGKDISEILIHHGYNSIVRVNEFLASNYPIS